MLQIIFPLLNGWGHYEQVPAGNSSGAHLTNGAHGSSPAGGVTKEKNGVASRGASRVPITQALSQDGVTARRPFRVHARHAPRGVAGGLYRHGVNGVPRFARFPL
jgi:hypothetical protein